MKRLFQFIMVALFATALVACDKENEQPENNNGNSTTLSDNTLVYDGVSYSGQAQAQYSGDYVEVVLSNNNADPAFGLNCRLDANCFDRSIDLTQHNVEITMFYHVYVEDLLDLKFQSYPQNFWCFLDGENYESSSCFTSGTFTASVADGILTVELDGTLANGKGLQYRIVTSLQSEPEPRPELSANTFVVGTQQYAINPTLSISDEDIYLFDATTPNGVYNIIIDIPTSQMGQTIDLTQAAVSDFDYYIDFQTTDLSFGLQSSQTQPIREINGEEVENVFSEGTMQLSEEDGVIVLHLSGTLSNGTYVGILMNVATTDITAMDNQIVYDGEVYSCSGIIRYNSSWIFPYEMAVYSQESPAYGRIEIKPNVISNTIDLASSSVYFAYRLSIMIPDTTIEQNSYSGGEFTGDVESGYWIIPTQSGEYFDGSLFTSGSMSVSEDEYSITFKLKGVLECGHSISFQSTVAKSDIEGGE